MQEPGGAGSFTSSAQRDPNPSGETEDVAAAFGACSHPSLAVGISPGRSVMQGNAEGAGLEPSCSPASGFKTPCFVLVQPAGEGGR